MAKQRKGGGGASQKKKPKGKNSQRANDSNAIQLSVKSGSSKRNAHNGNNRRRGCNDDGGDDDDAQFRASLSSRYTISEMNSDGNCLFRSLSDQLYRDGGNKHGVVRDGVCEYLSRNREEFRHFLLMEDDDEDVVDIDEYISKMREVRVVFEETTHCCAYVLRGIPLSLSHLISSSVCQS